MFIFSSVAYTALIASLCSNTLAQPTLRSSTVIKIRDSSTNNASTDLAAQFTPQQYNNILATPIEELGDSRDAADVSYLWLSFVRRLWANSASRVPDDSFQNPVAPGEWIRWRSNSPALPLNSQQLGPASIKAIIETFNRARPGDRTLQLMNFKIIRADTLNQIGTIEASARLLDSMAQNASSAGSVTQPSSSKAKRDTQPVSSNALTAFNVPAMEDSNLRLFVNTKEDDRVPPKFLVSFLGSFMTNNLYIASYSKKLSTFLPKSGLVHQLRFDAWSIQIFVENLKQGQVDVNVGHVEQTLRALLAYPAIKNGYKAFEATASLVDASGGMGKGFLRVIIDYTDNLPASTAPYVPWMVSEIGSLFGGSSNETTSSLRGGSLVTSGKEATVASA